MCGVIGILGHSPVNQSIYDGLTLVQHRGQDAAGIMTYSGGRFSQRKSEGLVRDVFRQKMGISSMWNNSSTTQNSHSIVVRIWKLQLRMWILRTSVQFVISRKRLLISRVRP